MYRVLTHLLILVGSVLIVFSNVYQNDFHLDDNYLVRGNPGIQQVHPIWRHFVDPTTISKLDRITQYRPMLPLTLSISYFFWGDDPVGYHIGSVLFHILGVIVFYFLICELLLRTRFSEESDPKRTSIALVTSLVFAIHPISGYPINYIAARDLLIMEFFLLSSLLSYLRMQRIGVNAKRWVITLIPFAIALFAKTNAIMFPAIIFLYHYTLGGKKLSNLSLWISPLPFAAVVGAQLAFKRFVVGFSDFTNAVPSNTDSFAYAYTQAKLHLFTYFSNFFWPFPIRSMAWVQPESSLLTPEVLLGSLFVVGSFGLAFWLRNRSPISAFCIFCYWILLLPTSSFVPLFYSVAHYRPYLASPFLYLLIVLFAAKFISSRYQLPVAATLVLYLGVSSFTLNKNWETGESLWAHSIAYGADPLAHMNYAMSLKDRADPRVLENLEIALRRGPGSVLAHINLGLLKMDLGDTEEGFKLVEKGANLRIDWPQSHYWLSVAYEKIGDSEKALHEAVIAANLETRDPQYPYRAVRLLQDNNKFQVALSYIKRLEKINPDYSLAQFLKAYSLQMTGEREEAIAVYRNFLDKKSHPQAHFNLGFALMEEGRCIEALPHFGNSVAARPNYSAAYLHMATCHRELGNAEKAELFQLVYSDLLAGENSPA